MATNTKPPLRPEPRLPPLPDRPKWHRRFLQKYLGSTRARIVATIVFLAAIVGLGDWGWGVYQNTIPEIGARDAEADSSFLLPFIIQNKSTVFDMKNVRITCGIGSFLLGNGKQSIFMVAGLTSGQSNAIIQAGHPVNFPCDASRLVQFEGKGGINIMGLHADIPDIAPMKVMSMSVTVNVKYDIMGWSRTYKSDLFTWVHTPQGSHWMKGKVIQ